MCDDLPRCDLLTGELRMQRVLLGLLCSLAIPPSRFFLGFLLHDQGHESSEFSCLLEPRRKFAKFMPASFSGMHLVFEVCQKKNESKEMLAVPYLVLQACISFFEVFQTKVAHSCCACFVRIRMPLLHVQTSFLDVHRPTRLCRTSYLCLNRLEWRGNSQIHQNSSVFSPFSGNFED